MFFKPKPNLPDGEKARIEFHLQLIGESIGKDRLMLPVRGRDAFLQAETPSEVVQKVGEHLSHDVGQIKVTPVLQQAGQCGGGG